jgi:hypothetical protein
MARSQKAGIKKTFGLVYSFHFSRFAAVNELFFILKSNAFGVGLKPFD